MKYRKKPIVIEAHQWFKNGDQVKTFEEWFFEGRSQWSESPGHQNKIDNCRSWLEDAWNACAKEYESELASLQEQLIAAREQLSQSQTGALLLKEQVCEADKVIGFYASSSDWCGSDMRTISLFDVDNVNGCRMGGKRAREYQKKWVKE